MSEVWAYEPASNRWQELGSLGPKEVNDAALDTESQRVILFGWGDDGKNGDTWAYDFNTDTWTEMQPEVSPPDRGFRGMGYDPDNDRILLWGGSTEPGISDVAVWAYDYNTNTWTTQEAPPDAPEQRAGMGLFYHPPSGRLIALGGLVEVGGQMVEETTWAYDWETNSWQALVPAKNPGKHAFFAMAYAPSVDKAILFGGELTDKWANDISDEVWIFDPTADEWDKAMRP